MEKQLIATAPRDGTLIIVSNDETEERMRWVEGKYASDKDNDMPIGIWEGESGETWSEEHGAGPTHWVAIG